MVYNWCGQRGWISKHDHGDIGEFFRISQYWVMYGTVAHIACTTWIVAKVTNVIPDIPTTTIPDDSKSPSRDAILTQEEYYDVLSGIRTGQWSSFDVHITKSQYERMRRFDFLMYNSSDMAPSPRWERALDQWCTRRDQNRAKHFCQALCHLMNNLPKGKKNVTSIELYWNHYDIAPLWSNTNNHHTTNVPRYRPRIRDHTALQVQC
jgi:hypothetical protein